MTEYNNYPKLIYLCDSMIKFEGGGPGKNNGGNLRCGNDRSLWPINAISATSGFCDFPSRAIGTLALYHKIYNICIGASSTYSQIGKEKFGVSSSRDLTIAQVIAIYAPSGDNNDPEHYAETVCKWASLNTTDVMSSLLINTPPQVLQAPQTSVQTPESTSAPMAFTIPKKHQSWWQRLLEAIFSIHG